MVGRDTLASGVAERLQLATRITLGKLGPDSAKLVLMKQEQDQELGLVWPMKQSIHFKSKLG